MSKLNIILICISIGVVVLAVYETIYLLPLLSNNSLSLNSYVNGWFPNWPTKGNEVWIDLLMNLVLIIGVPIESYMRFNRSKSNIDVGIGESRIEGENLKYLVVISLVFVLMLFSSYSIANGSFVIAP